MRSATRMGLADENQQAPLKKGSKMPFAYYVENLRIAGGYLKSRFR